MSDRNRGRIEETIRQTVAELLMRKVKDPRVVDVSVLRVEVSSDYSVAKIYYNLIGGSAPERISEAGKGLSSCSGFIRRHINKHLRLRVVPELVFFYDSSLDRAMKIEEIIDRIHTEEESGTEPADGSVGGDGSDEG